MSEALVQELRAHDALLRARGLDLWTGAEPTFTDRLSSDAWWLTAAEGGDKLERARVLARELAVRLGPGAEVGEVPGRQFPGEPAPRFALVVRFRRPGGPALLTVTPDPGVVEVNSAPAPDLETFHREAVAAYAAAEACGLSSERFRFNGRAADSGGGGQITLGGPSPAASPFFRHPTLLPRLVRYLANHPALSYAFAGECVGSASQGPRPDEGVRERFDELQVAVDRLEARGERVTPRELWETLAPLLVDASGNSHRAEVNIEKLWNAHLPGRGAMGVVELRSLRMPRSADHLAAVAALFRAVAARLVAAPFVEPLPDWGGALHDLIALPSSLHLDLLAVLEDLAAHGVAPRGRLREVLLERPEPLVELVQGGARLTITPAHEFWPLLGDVASQERAPARLVDASSERLEIAVTAPRGGGPGRVGVAGFELPLVPLDRERRHVAAVRYRAFTPRPGLHPGLPPSDPLVVTWEAGGEGRSVELHGWIPGGGSYDGLPADAGEARQRRQGRVRVVRPVAAPPRRASGARGVTLDLRRLEPPGAGATTGAIS
ncbi:MAG TPA: transglutaminase family protein [Anaeromyxobacter sp.]|nr:transglutaminase family protein [Anaeromyxobacter sp.]